MTDGPERSASLASITNATGDPTVLPEQDRMNEVTSTHPLSYEHARLGKAGSGPTAMAPQRRWRAWEQGKLEATARPDHAGATEEPDLIKYSNSK